MALASRTPSTQHAGPRCTVGKMLALIPPDDRATLVTWLADDTFTSTAIARELKDEYGESPSGFTIGRHRRGDCSCGTL